MLVTFGRDARARLAAIASGKAAAPTKSASFTEAETGAEGRDQLLLLAPVLGLVGTLGASPRLAAVAGGSGPIPLVFAGGDSASARSGRWTFTLPLTAFTSIGALTAAAR